MLQFILLKVHQALWEGYIISYECVSTPDYVSREQAAVIGSRSTCAVAPAPFQ